MTVDKYTNKILENDDKYIVFYSDWCGYSMKAINTLLEKKIPFKGYKIDKIDGNMTTLLLHLKQTSSLTDFDINHKTRPIVFYKTKYIGGYTELDNKLNRN
jgi:glutaredoxin